MGYDPAKGKDYFTQFDRAVELSLKVSESGEEGEGSHIL